MTKETSITALPKKPATVFERKLRPAPLIIKPINGNTGINQTKFKILLISLNIVALYGQLVL